jgi:glycosyltransferase involved in cell wall biosynthesis
MNHVLIVLSQPFNPNDGGVQRTSFKMGKYLSSNGYQVSYFSFSKSGHIVPEFANLFHVESKGQSGNKINIDFFHETIVEIKPNLVINQMPYDKGIRDALNFIRGRVDFVLYGCLRNSLFSFKDNLRDKIDYLIPKTVRWIVNNKIGWSVVNSYHNIKHRKVLKEILDIHDYFVLLTESNIKELEYFIGSYKSEKLRIIPNSIPEVHNSKITKEKILLHVGRINIPQKRSDLLLPVWKEICRTVSDWKFVIVGDGPYMATLKDEIKREKIAGIELVGYQSPESYYEKASIFMMTSAYEGFPNVIIEAQSFGNVPFAMDSYYALRDIVNDGKDAVLCKPFDTEQMGKKISILMQDSIALDKMIKASYENAGRFTIERVGKLWVELFESTSKSA